MKNKPRLLKPSEISCRVQQVTQGNGAIILLYKDARVDMNILDETYGASNWQRQHELINGNLFCTISIWDDEKLQWVGKQDVGTESNTEATKGEASDAFKRAGTNWGIGRELYTAPFIFVQLNADEVRMSKDGKPQANAKFGLSVADIRYNDDAEIIYLKLVDKKGNIRFTHGFASQEQAPGPSFHATEDATERRERKLTRMKLIAKDVSRHINSKDKEKIRDGIEAAEAFMKTTQTFIDAPYEDMTPEQFSSYLLNLNAYYALDTQEATA